MSKIKICGLSRLQDIEAVNKVQPDFIGFVFAESRRQISVQTAKLLKDSLNPAIKAVGVFVNEKIETIVTLCNDHVIDMVQLHGDEDLDYINSLKSQVTTPLIKAIRVKNLEDVMKSIRIPCDYLLFDTYQEKQFGGSGKVFDWSYLANIEKPYFLAGGIHSGNILQAKEQCNPYCIDISSGVETEGLKDSSKILDLVTKIRRVNEMAIGRFGEYGGQFIPETLMNAVIEIENAYNHFKNDETFCKELDDLLKNYAGRPSLLYYADRMTKNLGGAKIYLKREDLNHTGSHKINNVLGQVLLAKKMGKTRVIAETGAGQHGVATATAAALMGMECEIFMGEEDTKRQALNVFRMELLGAKVHPVASGTMTLKDAVNEALREWTTRVSDTHYVFGSVMGPHPFPMIVRDFQSIIGKEVKQELVEIEGKLPDVVLACVGGGSNAMGIFYDFIENPSVQLIGCEAAGLGIDTNKHAATIAAGTKGIFHGMNSYFCQDEYGQIAPVYSISAGLDYPGIGPEHAYLHDIGRASYVPVTDEEAVEAFEYLSQTEGIIPAIESAHAVAYAKKLAPTMGKDKILVINISGRGDKDVAAIARYRGAQIYE